MADHYARLTDDEAPPAPSPRQQKRAADIERYRALAAKKLDRGTIREIMGLSSDQERSFAKATGTATPKADRGPGECREARAPGGWEWCGRAKVQEESR